MLEAETQDRLKDYTPRVFWGRDMSAFLEAIDASKGGTLVAQVNDDGSIEWDTEGLALLGCANETAARLKLMKASRRLR